MKTRPVTYALLSALLFGLSTPAAKALLGSTDPAMLAGLLYCGAGLGAAVFRRLLRVVSSDGRIQQAALRKADLSWLSGAIVAGGIVGPLLLMFGLARTDAAAASLLLVDR
jgi:drug/metabolite transporter (DMT)-like permease